MGRAHRALQLTSGIALAAAASLPGSIVHEIVAAAGSGTVDRLRVGHPSGVMELRARVSPADGGWRLDSVTASRTARRLMEGSVFVPGPVAARTR